MSKAQHGIKWRADFVTHVCKKFTFRVICPLGLREGIPHGLFDVLTFADVPEHAYVSLYVTPVILQWHGSDRNREHKPVLVGEISFFREIDFTFLNGLNKRALLYRNEFFIR